MRTIRTLATGVLLHAVAGCGNGGPTGPGGNNNGTSGLRLEEVVTGLNAPVLLTHAGDSRLFIVEQGGRIRIVENGQLLGAPFLDIRNIVLHQGEQGLLSMAFHPDYETNGFFYVYHTAREEAFLEGQPHVACAIEIVENERIIHEFVVRS